VPKVTLNQLYKYTPMQQTFGIILLALVDGRPVILSLREMLENFIRHRKLVIERRTRFELAKAEARAHILEGLRIALQFLDEVIRIIRSSSSVDTAREGLMSRFGLSEKQATAILEMRLQRLTALEREKIEAEYQEVMALIEQLRAILADERLVYNIIKEDLAEVRKKYGDERRTKLGPSVKDISDEDLIPQEDMVVTITHRGYIKRLSPTVYRPQRRGGRGVSGSTVREDDFIAHLFVASTHAYLCFFTNRGRIYRVKVHEIPEAGRQAKGISVANLIALEAGERVAAVQTLTEASDQHFWVFATKRGVVKRTALSDYGTWRGGGIIAITLDEDDELIGVESTDGHSDILLATRQGQVIRFEESRVRPVGRSARGVTGIRVQGDDRVVSLATVAEQKELLVLTENGFGKRTRLTQFRRTNRGGQGVMGMRLTNKTGSVAGILPVEGHEEFMVISSEGILIRLEVASVSQQGRASQGVRVMRMEDNHHVSALALVTADEQT
jgi:DNA gyrase subunit A